MLVYHFWLQLVRFLISVIHMDKKSQGIIATALRAGQSEVRIPLGARDFSLLQIVRTGSGAHPASYTMGTGSFPGVKRPGRGVDQPPLAQRLRKV